jgi:hypothetical protein
VRAGLVAVVLWASAAGAADLVVSATVSPQRARVGDTLSLTIEARGAQNVAVPALQNLDAFEARYVGPSTQVSIVQGQISSTVQHRYSLVPRRPGRFQLGPFVVEHDGKRYETAAIDVDIAVAGEKVAPDPRRQESASGQMLRLVLHVPRREVYFHEQVPLEVLLYVGGVRAELAQRFPLLEGQGLAIDEFGDPVQRQQVIDGVRVQVLTYRTTVVPLQTGSLTLGPASLRLNLLQRRRGRLFDDSFFGSLTSRRVPRDVSSEPLSLKVSPLPTEGKPDGFSGAVGRFTLDVEAAPTEVNAGDPVTLRIGLRGNGNLSHAAPPALVDSAGFRIYEATEAAADGGFTRVFEQVLIPNDVAIGSIPPVRFSFFDPEQGRYQTLESAPVPLAVRPAVAAGQAQIIDTAAATGQQKETLGRDIIYIKDEPGRLVTRSAPWYGSVLFLIWPPVPLLLFAVAVWHARRRERLSGDRRYARFTAAGKEARRGLHAAQAAIGSGDRGRFYDVVSRTMQDYLAAKLDLPPGAVGADVGVTQEISTEMRPRLRQFFDICEQMRFAPGEAGGDMQTALDLARELVQEFERRQRSLPADRVRAAG